MKHCNKCNEIKPVEQFNKRTAQPDGRHLYCKTCTNKDKRRRAQTANNRYYELIQNAKKRNLILEITPEQHQEILKKPCEYCRFELHPSGAGLDRKDSSRGYTSDNVVPCCKECNQTKSNSYSYQEFLVIGEAVRRIKLQRLQPTKPGASGATTPTPQPSLTALLGGAQ